MRPMRIDWPLLKARMEAAGVEPAASCLICVTEAGRQLFLAISERLTWRATYRVDGYDYGDFAELQDYIDDTIGALTVADCSEIVNNIVTQVVTQIQTSITQAQYYTDACCFLEDGNPPNIPPPSEEPPPANSEDRDALCIQAQIAHDKGKAFLEQVFDYAELGGGITAALITLLLAGLALPLVLLAFLIGFIVTIVADDFTDDALTGWEDLKHDIICAIVNAGSATQAKADVDAVIDASSLPGVIKDLFKVLYSQAAINQIWNGDFEDTAGYSADYCQDCAEWENIAGIAVTVLTEDGNKFIDIGGMSNTYVTVGEVLDANTNLDPPHVVCFVETGKSAHFIGDTNHEGDFDGTPGAQWLSLGCHSGNHGPGLQSVAFSQFKLLVSTAANPDNYFWISAQLSVAPGFPDVAGEFIVDEESGIVGFTDIPFNGNGEFYGKAVMVTIPEE